MGENNNSNQEIQISSTTLGFEGEGGKKGGIIAIGKEAVSKEAYTDTIVKNALKAEEITQREFPNAEFGVSVLASAVNPAMLKGMIGSVDYPYFVKWDNNFLKEKQEKVKSEGYTGIGATIAFAKELAYAQLQSRTESGQINSAVETAEYSSSDIVKLRTCIETVSLEEEIRKIKEVNSLLKEKGKEVLWVIEPNKKITENLEEYLRQLDAVKKFNPALSFGIDLDMGGFSKEDRNLIQVLDKLDQQRHLPIFVSLSGYERIEGDIRTHLPLGNDPDSNKSLGEWLKDIKLRGKNVPGLVVETSPVEERVLDDYKGFLKDLYKGYNS